MWNKRVNRVNKASKVSKEVNKGILVYSKLYYNIIFKIVIIFKIAAYLYILSFIII